MLASRIQFFLQLIALFNAAFGAKKNDPVACKEASSGCFLISTLSDAIPKIVPAVGNMITPKGLTFAQYRGQIFFFKTSLLEAGIKNGDLEFVRKALQEASDRIRRQIGSQDILDIACKRGSPELINLLENECNAVFNEEHVFVAMRNNNSELVRHLTKQDIETNLGRLIDLISQCNGETMTAAFEYIADTEDGDIEELKAKFSQLAEAKSQLLRQQSRRNLGFCTNVLRTLAICDISNHFSNIALIGGVHGEPFKIALETAIKNDKPQLLDKVFRRANIDLENGEEVGFLLRAIGGISQTNENNHGNILFGDWCINKSFNLACRLNNRDEISAMLDTALAKSNIDALRFFAKKTDRNNLIATIVRGAEHDQYISMKNLMNILGASVPENYIDVLSFASTKNSLRGFKNFIKEYLTESSSKFNTVTSDPRIKEIIPFLYQALQSDRSLVNIIHEYYLSVVSASAIDNLLSANIFLIHENIDFKRFMRGLWKNKQFTKEWAYLRDVVVSRNANIKLFKVLETLIHPMIGVIERKIFLIQNVESKLFLDVPKGSSDNGRRIIQYKLNNNANQKWRCLKVGSFCLLQSVATKKCLSTTRTHGFITQESCNFNDRHQHFTWMLVENEAFTIHPRINENHCFQVTNRRKHSAISHVSCVSTSGERQSWIIHQDQRDSHAN